MTEEDIAKKPELTVGDAVHAATRAILSAAPVAGGGLVELFSAVFRPPMARRFEAWIASVVNRLNELQERVDGFTIEALSENDTFVSTVMHATQTAVRNHQRDKLEALRNAVLNAALPNPPEEDLQLRFVRFIDELGPWHLRILKFFDDPLEWGKKHNIEYPKWRSATASGALEHAFSELQGRRDLYDQIVKDLDSPGLMRGGRLHTTMTARGIFEPRTTSMGKQFLAFITSPSALQHK